MARALRITLGDCESDPSEMRSSVTSSISRREPGQTIDLKWKKLKTGAENRLMSMFLALKVITDAGRIEPCDWLPRQTRSRTSIGMNSASMALTS